jgi:hypothetical protein
MRWKERHSHMIESNMPTANFPRSTNGIYLTRINQYESNITVGNRTTKYYKVIGLKDQSTKKDIKNYVIFVLELFDNRFVDLYKMPLKYRFIYDGFIDEAHLKDYLSSAIKEFGLECIPDILFHDLLTGIDSSSFRFRCEIFTRREVMPPNFTQNHVVENMTIAKINTIIFTNLNAFLAKYPYINEDTKVIYPQLTIDPPKPKK